MRFQDLPKVTMIPLPKSGFWMGFPLEGFLTEDSPLVWESLVPIGVGKKLSSARYHGGKLVPAKDHYQSTFPLLFLFFSGAGLWIRPVSDPSSPLVDTSVPTPYPMFHCGKNSYLQAMAITRTFLQNEGPEVTTIVCISCIPWEDISRSAISTCYQNLSLRVPTSSFLPSSSQHRPLHTTWLKRVIKRIIEPSICREDPEVISKSNVFSSY